MCVCTVVGRWLNRGLVLSPLSLWHSFYLRLRRLALGHPVADARLGEDVGGVVRVVAQLAAEAAYDGAHGPHVAVAFRPPDPLQQMLVGHHAPGVRRKHGEHPVLDGDQPDRTAGHGHAAFRVVDLQVPQRVGFGGLCLFGGLPPAQGRPDPRRQLRKRPGVPDDKAQRNFTDTESRIIPAPGGKDFLEAYNCQAVVDSAHQVIVAARATNQTSDKQQAAAMMEETIDNVGAVPREVSADAGYYSAKAVDELYALGVDPFVAPEQTRHGRVVPPAPRGRIPSHLSPRDRMRRKLQTKRGRQRYALRMQTVEPVFGQIKQGRGFRQFLLRGLKKVNGEWSLICTGHNLLKLFRFGVNLHRKARGDGPAQRIRNFAEVVSTALFAKLSGGRLGQPAKLVVAIHCR